MDLGKHENVFGGSPLCFFNTNCDLHDHDIVVFKINNIFHCLIFQKNTELQKIIIRFFNQIFSIK